MTTAARLTWSGDAPRGARWPGAIKPGDRLGIFAPAHTFDRAEAARGAAMLRSWGFEVKIPRLIFKKHRYLAGPDEDRLASMEELMADDSVAALMAVRGGFGCQRLLPMLEPRWKHWPDKAIFGFSDLTAIHLARLKSAGVIGCHAPMLVSLGKASPLEQADRISQNDLKFFLKANTGQHHWNFARKNILRPGRVTGPTIGGNLTLVTAMLASPCLPDLTGAILMLEEIGEPGYKLDRLLTTLSQSPACQKAAALIFGHFTACGPPKQVRVIIKEATRNFPGPVIINAPFGHEARNRAFPVGAMAELEVF